MVDLMVIDSIPLRIEAKEVLRELHIGPDSEDAVWVEALVNEAESIGRPKVVYRAVDITDKGDDYVVIDGVRFDSRVLRVNLEHVHRVFAFVASCGMELQEWMESIEDMLEQYAADVICRMALTCATQALNAELKQRFIPGKSATMNPGSLSDWPLPEQQKLFALLGGSPLVTGVELSETSLMRPYKSVSGLHFPSEASYENCQLCPREKCPGRRAEYDPDLYRTRYSMRPAGE